MRELFLKFLSQLFCGIGSFQGRFGLRSLLHERSPKTAVAFGCPQFDLPRALQPNSSPKTWTDGVLAKVVFREVVSRPNTPYPIAYLLARFARRLLALAHPLAQDPLQLIVFLPRVFSFTIRWGAIWRLACPA
jgi:hypothetical protein